MTFDEWWCDLLDTHEHNQIPPSIIDASKCGARAIWEAATKAEREAREVQGKTAVRVLLAGRLDKCSGRFCRCNTKAL